VVPQKCRGPELTPSHSAVCRIHVPPSRQCGRFDECEVLLPYADNCGLFSLYFDVCGIGSDTLSVHAGVGGRADFDFGDFIYLRHIPSESANKNCVQKLWRLRI